MAKPAVRLGVVQVAFGLAIVAVVARAAQVQLVQGANYRAKARQQRTERVVLPARRGAIYDRNGVPLALTRDVYHLGVAPRELRDRARDAATLARALGFSRPAMDRALRRPYAYFRGPYPASRVEPVRSVPGVHLTPELQRFYPSGDFARSLIGRPADEGRPASGLERALDTLLAGRPGSAVVLRDGQGRRYESPGRLGAFPVPGHDVYLTLDATLQDIVERALADAIERYDAAGGDVVVLQPHTGEVLAIASRRADGSVPPTPFTSVFEPGSTAKIFAAAALLEANLVTTRDSVYAERGVWVRPYRTIRDDHPAEWLTLRGAMEVSSNIAMVKLVDRLDAARQYLMLRAFGFGAPTGIEFPTESRGSLERPDRWSGVSAASLAMGYEVAVTPLQLAAAYAAIANDGVLVRPTLVRETRAADGTVRYRQRPEPVRRVVRPGVARELRAMLRGAVYDDGGTGSTAALSAYELAGKTGTARRATPQGYMPGAYTATFASLFPADDPQLAMVVKLDDPRGAYARLTAAPVSRSVIEQALAARTSALDAQRLGTEAAPPRAPTVGTGSVPYVVAWPPASAPPPVVERRVPDVTGLSLRAAAAALHQRGFQARVRGWGVVAEMAPAAGTSAAAGTVVTLVAAPARR
ncbi:MAG: penicillin-binding protein 2 [Gemmatimonadetes bacterium]|nr:penicillin-binding protein 2 [Gemmatimonadota bacterium]